MRRTLTLLSLLVAALFWTACTETTTTNTTGNANITNGPATANRGANANGGPAAQPGGAALSDADKKFINDAASGGLAEVEMGRLATKNGQSAEVKKFGQRMIDDHTKANNELSQLASSKGITPPKEPNSEQKSTMDRLSKLKGEAFDRAYMDDMVKDHTKDVAEFEKEANQGGDNDVKAFASKTLPTLQEHLRMAQSIAPKERKEAASQGNK